MANPKTAAECLRVATLNDPALKIKELTPAWWAHCIGGTGVVNVYFFDELGEIEGSYQQITVAAEVGIMGLPLITFPVSTQTGQGVAETIDARAIWMEIIAVSGSLTWGLYGQDRDWNGAATFLKSGTHRSYTFANGSSLRLGPAPFPKYGAGGAPAAAVSIPLSTATDRSGAVTAGGTAQNAMAANASRQGGFIYNPITAAQQNIAAAESLFVSESGTANANTSVEIKPGGMFQIGSTNAISVLGATTSHAWSGEER